MEDQNNTKRIKNLKPLAERMRPRNFEEMLGQNELLQKRSPFMTVLKAGNVYSMILWGPPGVGKTTIARIIAGISDLKFDSISAVTSGVKDVREILGRAEQQFLTSGTKNILFIDEIHRFNKAQQDALLHAVEEGYIILIGATTENPSFEVISPLLSRCKVHKLELLNKEEISQVIKNALHQDEWLNQMSIDESSIDFDTIYQFSSGDARKALSLVEQSVIFASSFHEKNLKIDRDLLKKVAAQPLPGYDKNGDAHYDFISAFIKSVRGSDADAALYWLARMLLAGEKPEFIARRLIILASEDIGNAEPFALTLANSAFDAVHKIGMPEARIILAQTTTFLSSLPKSNAAYLAIERAMKTAGDTLSETVPLHLRNAPTQIMKEMGYAEDYKYPHDFAGHFIRQTYWPDGIKPQLFYQPQSIGKEKAIKERLQMLWSNSKENK